MTKEEKLAFAGELTYNLTSNILPYWLSKMTAPEGGYYGRRDGNDMLHADEPRGAILNARILWTLSAAARFTGDPQYAEAAARQMRYVADTFIDREYGGVFWAVNPDGTPSADKKQFYAIAFTIYGLAEYVRLCGDKEALELAVELFRCIEKHSRDNVRGGYFEASARDWSPLADVRLSDKDENASKTMNTHLHILEGYANLLRVWPTEECREATASLLRLFNDVIVDSQTHNLGLFFDDDFRRLDAEISYGHDIEASWLMFEAAEVIGDAALLAKTADVTRHVALAALRGRCYDGSMVYERHANGHFDNEKHWWVQAENVVGQIYLARFHSATKEASDKALADALQSWRDIDSMIVDHENGEWYWSRMPDGSINRRDDKAGFWKCPYHNSRMCIEAASQLREMAEE